MLNKSYQPPTEYNVHYDVENGVTSLAFQDHESQYKTKHPVLCEQDNSNQHESISGSTLLHEIEVNSR